MSTRFVVRTADQGKRAVIPGISTVVATVGNSGYLSFADAIARVGAMTGIAQKGITGSGIPAEFIGYTTGAQPV